MSIGRFAATLGMAAFLPLVSSSDAKADPITFTYRIDITERCGAFDCGLLSVSFPLVLSFDSGVTLAINEPKLVERDYGAPTFSPIPLERPEVFPGARHFAGTSDVVFQREAQSTWSRQAIAGRGAEFVQGDFVYTWNLGIIGQDHSLLRVPSLSPASLASFLNGGAFVYSFGGITVDGQLRPKAETAEGKDESSDFVSYHGTAVLQDPPAPVPEPMSMLLVGTGLCGIGAREWRRRRLARKAS